MKSQALAALTMVLLSSCAPNVDEKLISYFGAPDENVSEARKAAEICLKNSFQQREPTFRLSGYVDAMFENPERDIEEIRGTVLIQPNSGVVVQLGEDGKGSSGCIVGLKGMSPRQSHDLALPWVRHFNGVSNEERGQGLTPNAIQVWRGVSPRSRLQVFIVAYKTWDILEVPGAAIRLSQ